MSEKKMFTAEEVARMLLEKAHNTLKKHEDLLQKFLTSDFVGANKELYRYKFLSKMKVN